MRAFKKTVDDKLEIRETLEEVKALSRGEIQDRLGSIQYTIEAKQRDIATLESQIDSLSADKTDLQSLISKCDELGIGQGE